MTEGLSKDSLELTDLVANESPRLTPAFWVEKTRVQDRPDRQDGPDRLGAALWSPQRGKDGRDSYAKMREIRVGDFVLHLKDSAAIVGLSVVAAPLDTAFVGLKGTDSEGKVCYRIALQDFRLFDPPLRNEWLFDDPEIAEPLRAMSTRPPGRGLFFNRNLQPNQGGYLTEAPPSLLAALNTAYQKHTGRHLPGLPATFEDVADDDQEEDLGVTDGSEPAALRRSWVYSPGRQAVHWDEFYQDAIMALGWDAIGDFNLLETIQAFRQALEVDPGTEKDQGQNARMCFDFAHTMRPGDIIYAKRGRNSFVGRGIVEGDYHHDPSRRNYTNVRKVRWTARGEWPWPEKLPMKTLTEWTNFPALLEKAERLVTEVATPLPPQTLAAERQLYSIDDALSDLFMPRDTFACLVEIWEAKKNLILQGAPGVGKTFVARRLAYSLMGYRDPTRVRTVQFHQSYGYEDFVQGYRPSNTGFSLREGVFLNFCARAQADPAEHYVFIIDEINRGNLSKILGELMLLIEPDKRSPEWAVKLAYAEKAEERFYVPSNVFILGMMNTADRSLAVVDYALRRRFAFATIHPAFGEEVFRAHLVAYGVAEVTADQLIERMMALNDAIAADTTNLGRGYRIGHSFFTPGGVQGERGAAWYKAVVETEIVPLLQEYWFDQPDKVAHWRARLLE
jgi:hypothetical protein